IKNIYFPIWSNERLIPAHVYDLDLSDRREGS
ncbi:unnamed protein product, partial [marine sediment metagenome]